MTEENLKGLFGGGEADAAQGAVQPAGRERRGGGGGGRGRRGGRRRRHSPEEIAQADDFINRYTTGSPSEGFSSDEAVNYLRQVRQEAPPEVLQRAAVETVRNLPDDQRKAFAEMLQRRQAGSNMVTIERTGETRATEGRGGSPSGGGMDDMLGGLFGGLFGGGDVAQPQPQPRQMPQGQGGFGADDMLGGLLGGLLGGGMAQPQTRGHSQPDTNPFDDLLGGMFGGGGCRHDAGSVSATAPGAGRRGRRDPEQPAGQSGPRRYRRLRHERDDGWESLGGSATREPTTPCRNTTLPAPPVGHSTSGSGRCPMRPLLQCVRSAPWRRLASTPSPNSSSKPTPATSARFGTTTTAIAINMHLAGVDIGSPPRIIDRKGGGLCWKRPEASIWEILSNAPNPLSH